jgi:hypothetical protein
LYDYSIEDIRKLIRNEAKRNFLFIEYEYWDLGKGDEYYDEQCKALFYNKDDIDREILNKWKTVSTVHPLGQEALALLSKHARNPNHIIVLNKIFRMKFYKDPETLDWGRPYVISGDCSNNVGADYSALVVTDPYTYEIVATVRTNMFSTMLFGKMIAEKEFTILGFKNKLNFEVYDGFAYCPNYRGSEYCMEFPKIEFVNKSSEIQSKIREYMNLDEKDNITVYEILQSFNEMLRDCTRVEIDKKTSHYKEKCMWK